MHGWLPRLSLALSILAAGVAPQTAGAQAPGVGSPAPASAVAPVPTSIRLIRVEGNQRIEQTTVLSYMVVRPGSPYNPATVDQSLKTLFATGLFSDVTIRRDGPDLVVSIVENPIINRVLFIGNKAIEKKDLVEEIQLKPRIVYTRTKVEDDVQKIVELYRRSGRFAAEVRPSVVQLPQNRVDLVFEINEGPVTGIRKINFIGNEKFSDSDLRGVVVTQESRWWNLFASNDNYDPDRLTYDRELLRQHYLSKGYADFRVVSAVAELTPDREDFFITVTVEEGEQYAWGEIKVETKLDALNADFLRRLVAIQEGDIYNSKRIEETIETLTFAAGAAGYAFVDIRPRVKRDKDQRRLNVTFRVNEGPRVYVERVNINGNTRTLDRVIRREFRIIEGDPYNKILVNQSRNRIRALGFFKEVEITEQPGSAPDRTVINVDVEEQPTGELSFGFGFSSVDNFLGEVSISERNLLGRGQFLRLRLSLSDRREQIDLRFTEPYLFGRNLAGGFEVFRVATDFEESSFNTNSTGMGLSTGFPISEYARFNMRYTLRNDEIEVDERNCALRYPPGTVIDGVDVSGRIAAPEDLSRTDLITRISSSICDAAGTDVSSILGYTVSYDRRNDPIRPTRGFDVTVGQDIAGLGGNVNYLRSVFDAGIYRGIVKDVIASLNVSAGYIFPLTDGEDGRIRLNDRFFRGGNSFRGFENAGLGPRDCARAGSKCRANNNNSLGGRLFAIGSFEVSFPTGLPEDLGIGASFFTDFGTVGIVDNDIEGGPLQFATDEDGNILIDDTTGEPIRIVDVRDDASLRASAGVSIFWESPFGPVRFDLAHVLLKEDYDDTQAFRFSAGTRF